MMFMRPQNASMYFNVFITFLLLYITGTSAYSPFNESKWIWDQDLTQDHKAPPGSHSFRRIFHHTRTESPAPCIILITSDDIYHLFLNGEHLGSGTQTLQAQLYNGLLQPGKNVFAINATNLLHEPNPAGVLVDVQVPHEDGNPERIVSDSSWRVNPQVQNGFEKLEYDDSSWPYASVVTNYGSAPWGYVNIPPIASAYGAYGFGLGPKFSGPSSQFLPKPVQSQKLQRYPKTKAVPTERSVYSSKSAYGTSYADRESSSAAFSTPVRGGGFHGDLEATLTLNAPSTSSTAITRVVKQIEEPQTTPSLLGGIFNLVGSLLGSQKVNKQSTTLGNPTPLPSPESQSHSLSANLELSLFPQQTSRRNIEETLALPTQLHSEVEPVPTGYPQRGHRNDLGGVATARHVLGNLTPDVQHVTGATEQNEQTAPLQDTEDNEPLSATIDRILEDELGLKSEAEYPTASGAERFPSPSEPIIASHAQQESQITSIPGIVLPGLGKASIGLGFGVTIPSFSHILTNHRPDPTQNVFPSSVIGEDEETPEPTGTSQDQEATGNKVGFGNGSKEPSGKLGKGPQGIKIPFFDDNNDDDSEPAEASPSDESNLSQSPSEPESTSRESPTTLLSSVQGASNNVDNDENGSLELGINLTAQGPSATPTSSQPSRSIVKPSFSSEETKEQAKNKLPSSANGSDNRDPASRSGDESASTLHVTFPSEAGSQSTPDGRVEVASDEADGSESGPIGANINASVAGPSATSVTAQPTISAPGSKTTSNKTPEENSTSQLTGTGQASAAAGSPPLPGGIENVSSGSEPIPTAHETSRETTVAANAKNEQENGGHANSNLTLTIPDVGYAELNVGASLQIPTPSSLVPNVPRPTAASRSSTSGTSSRSTAGNSGDLGIEVGVEGASSSSAASQSNDSPESNSSATSSGAPAQEETGSQLTSTSAPEDTTRPTAEVSQNSESGTQPTPTNSGLRQRPGYGYGSSGRENTSEAGSEGASQGASQPTTSNSINNQQQGSDSELSDNELTTSPGTISEGSSVDSKSKNREIILGEGPESAGPAIVSILSVSGTGIAIPSASTNSADNAAPASQTGSLPTLAPDLEATLGQVFSGSTVKSIIDASGAKIAPTPAVSSSSSSAHQCHTCPKHWTSTTANNGPSAVLPAALPMPAAESTVASGQVSRETSTAVPSGASGPEITQSSTAEATGKTGVESSGKLQSAAGEISKSKVAGEASTSRVIANKESTATDDGATGVAKSSTNAAPLDVPCGCPPKSTESLALRNANWIWTNEIKGGVAPVGARAFRRELVLPRGLKASGVKIQIGVDDHFSLYVQGKLVGSGEVWSAAHTFDVDLGTPTSEVVIAVNAANAEGGPAGLVADIQLVIEGCDGSPVPVTSDGSWKYSAKVPSGFEKAEFDDSAWDFAKIEGKYGMSPWGELSMPYGVVKAKAG